MYQTPHSTKAVVFDNDGHARALQVTPGPLDGNGAGVPPPAPPRLHHLGRPIRVIQAQVLDQLTAPEQVLSRLHLMPTSGTRYYSRQQGAWSQVYSKTSRRGEGSDHAGPRRNVKNPGVLGRASARRTHRRPRQPPPDSALGQAAPLDAKAAWDPDGTKKSLLVAHATPLLPDFEVRGGGSTSIDVTRWVSTRLRSSQAHDADSCGPRGAAIPSVIGLMRPETIIQYWPSACHASRSRAGKTRLL